MGRLKIYKASAGSGKTHQLTLEYLKLALKYHDNYRHILAVTFTNKATEEMKNRIMAELSLIADGASSPVSVELLNDGIKESQELLRIAASRLLSDILFDYSNFGVSTIDSFFQKILRNFIRETGLQPNFQAELDIDRILDLAVEKLYMEIGNDTQLTNWLIRFAEENIEKGKNWNLKNEIVNFSYEITKENFSDFAVETGKTLEDKEIIRNIIERLTKEIAVFENKMSSTGREALKLIENSALTIADFSYGYSGFAAYFDKIANKIEFEPKARARNAVDSPDKWASVKTPAEIKQKITESYHSGLNDLLKSAVNYFDQHFYHYNSYLLIKRYFNILGLLTNLVEKMKEIRSEENILLISDVNILLKSIINNNDAPFIYEKTGSYFRHFLIDEFQDTSTIQWENFKPLLQDSLASGQTNMIVGDIKQSIYRWRGGDWNLLLNRIYDDIHPELTETLNLSNNWRSGKTIIQFNNSLFFNAGKKLEDLYNADLDEKENPSRTITKAYEHASQTCPERKTSSGGIVKISFFTKKNEEGNSWKEQVNEQLPALIDSVLQKNYRQGDITILVRTASDGQKLAGVLLEKGKYNIISKDSIYIETSAAVRLLLSILRYMDNPGDKISQLNILKEYGGYILSGESVSEIIQQSSAERNSSKGEYFKTHLPPGFYEKINFLKNFSLFDLTEQLIRIFGLNKQVNELNFIQSFQDAVLGFSLKNKANIGGFLEWWDVNGIKLTIQVPDDIDAIRIMTIHKAKGLDFKILLIPYCDWKLDHNPYFDNILWSRSAKNLILELAIIPVKYSKDLATSCFRQDYLKEKLQCYMDNLNLLYVAFTRPVNAIYVMAPLPSVNGTVSSVSDLLYLSIKQHDQSLIREVKNGPGFLDLKSAWDETKMLFEAGELNAQAENTEAPQDEYLPPIYFSAERMPEIKVKRNSIDFSGDDDRTTQINYGIFMHDILSRIENRDKVDYSLNELYFAGHITLNERNDLRQKLNEIIDEKPEWFSGDYEVRTESPVIIQNGRIIVPDRVLIHGKNATVIDFKFGAEEKKHFDQVKKYKETLLKMGYLKVEGYLFYPDVKIIREV